MGKPTITDASLRAGVAKSTVSAALNGKPNVSEATRRRVRTAEPVIGVIVKEVANPFYSELLAGVGDFARQRGYLLTIGYSRGDLEEEMRLVRAFRRQGVHGVVISPASSTAASG